MPAPNIEDEDIVDPAEEGTTVEVNRINGVDLVPDPPETIIEN